MSERTTTLVDEFARPLKVANGTSRSAQPEQGAPRAASREQVLNYFARQAEWSRRAKLSYDAARSGTDLDGHWSHADALDADSANSFQVRQTLRNRSRYEVGSNSYYDGILGTYADMLVGGGPKLRMMTGSRAFNQLVEREFTAWCERVQLRRKLWCLAFAYAADGEAFAVLQTNPLLPGVRLDVMLVEAEQCQTPNIPFGDRGYIDGIKLDEFGNVAWYDILPEHPGGSQVLGRSQPLRVAPQNVCHWFLLKRAGAHRGIPQLTSSMSCGAISRRVREAVATAAESAASVGALLTSKLGAPGDQEPDPVAPFTSFEMERRTLLVAPMGWDAQQVEGRHPNAQYDRLHRTLINEQGRPIAMPYNLAAGDSSTYSFASGKLDTLGFRGHVDGRRADCNDLVLDRIFAAWFREWTIVAARRDIPPTHQWDWPVHPVIDAQAEASALKTELETAQTIHRQVFSRKGEDIEDQLVFMAEDYFGEASDDTIAKCRTILLLKSCNQHTIPYVAALVGVSAAKPGSASSAQPAAASGESP